MSTIPLVRKFLPLAYTVPVIAFAIAGSVIYKCQTNDEETAEALEYRMAYSQDGIGYNWYEWSKNKPPSEPYVKRTSNSFFSVPSI